MSASWAREDAPGTSRYGVNAMNVGASYGTLGQAHSTVWPSGRAQTDAWLDSRGRLWLQGGHGYPSETSPAVDLRGSLNDLWSYASLCVSGVNIPNSLNYCTGFVTGEVCDFTCDDGYVKTGQHVCKPTGRLEGGHCAMSTCAAPVLTVGQQVVFGCEDGGAINSVCYLTCADGYVVSGGANGLCLPDAGKGTASYQGQYTICTPWLCPLPTLGAGEEYTNGCTHAAHHGCRLGIGPWACRDSGNDLWTPGEVCELGCQDGYVQAATIRESRGTCMSEYLLPLAKYQGHMANCVASLRDDIGGWAWHGGSLSAAETSRDVVAAAAAAASGGCADYQEQRAHQCGGSCAPPTMDCAVDPCSAVTPAGMFETGCEGKCVLRSDCSMDSPTARLGHKTWQSVSNNTRKLWMFGGSTKNGELLNDLWWMSVGSGGVYHGSDAATAHPGNDQWVRYGGNRQPNALTAPALWPGARRDHATCTDITGVAWLFGGFGHGDSVYPGLLSDLWSWGRAAGTAGGDPCAMLAPAGSWEVCGGLGGDCVPSGGCEMWRYHGGGLSAGNRGTVAADNGIPSTENWPAARWLAAMWGDTGGAIFVFGGIGYSEGSGADAGYLNDLWSHSASAAVALPQWIRHGGANHTNGLGSYQAKGVFSASNWPGARAMAPVSQSFGMRGATWLFGGKGYGSEVRKRTH